MTDTLSAPTGLEQLLSIQAAGPDHVGVTRLLGMTLAEVEEGFAAFEARTKPEFGNPHLTLHGGIAATLLDSAMGCAVHSTLPAGAGYTTVDLNVTFVRSATLHGLPLRAEGKVIHRGSRIVTAEGRLVDEFDRLVATATSTCLVLGQTFDRAAA